MKWFVRKKNPSNRPHGVDTDDDKARRYAIATLKQAKNLAFVRSLPVGESFGFRLKNMPAVDVQKITSHLRKMASDHGLRWEMMDRKEVTFTRLK